MGFNKIVRTVSTRRMDIESVSVSIPTDQKEGFSELHVLPNALMTERLEKLGHSHTSRLSVLAGDGEDAGKILVSVDENGDHTWRKRNIKKDTSGNVTSYSYDLAIALGDLGFAAPKESFAATLCGHRVTEDGALEITLPASLSLSAAKKESAAKVVKPKTEAAVANGKS